MRRRRRVRLSAPKNMKRVTVSTEAVNVRIRELKEGNLPSTGSKNRITADITSSVRTLYSFGNAGLDSGLGGNHKSDGSFRRLVSIIENANRKTGPSFETPEGLEDTFQAVFLQDSEIQKASTEVIEEITRQSRLYRFCAIYVPIDMDAWLRDNLNNPKKTRDAIPYAVADPFDGQYIVEREEGSVTYSVYFVPDDDEVLDSYNIIMYECNPRFILNESGRSTIGTGRSIAGPLGGNGTQIHLWSPYWEFIGRRDDFSEAQNNEKLVDKHRSIYVDYVMPPIPKDLNLNEMTEQQILARAAGAVGHPNPNVQANDPGSSGSGPQDITYDTFLVHMYKSGFHSGYNTAAVPTNAEQSHGTYKRDARIERLRPGETVNRNPHVPLLRDPRELRKQYEMDLCAEMNVPYSRYRMSEKGSYRKDDNAAESEMFATTILNLQEEMRSIFYTLYQHTFGIIDGEMLKAYRKWERNIAFGPDDLEILKRIVIGNGQISDSDADIVSDSGSDLDRAAYLVSEISQLTPFDIAMFSYMNSVDVPEEDRRHLVTISFLPPSESGTTELSDYINVYKAGILQEEMVQAIRSRLNLPEPEDGEEIRNADPNPRPTKRTRTSERKPKEDDDTPTDNEKDT